VSVSANSGDNGVSSTGTLQDGSISTGDSVAVSNVKNIANTNLINTEWFLSVVNTMGAWTGNVYYLPNQVSMEQTALGMTFLSSSSSNDALNEQFSQAMAAEINNGNEIEVEIENTNTAVINNQVNVTANSGLNAIAGGDIAGANIATGYSQALSNIFNFANANLVNSNMSVGLMNVFGNWKGNIVFGYPDLAVTQKLLQGNVPNGENQRVNYEISYSNTAGSGMPNALLRWQFDPGIFKYSHSNLTSVKQVEPGLLELNLGKISPLQNGRVQVQLTTRLSQAEGDQIRTVSDLYGTGPEKNMVNNVSVLTALASSEFEDVPELPNPNGPKKVQSNYVSRGKSVIMSKTNDSNGRLLKAGDTVKFTINIENKNLKRIHSAVVYDSLIGPDGTVLTMDKYDLNTLKYKEKVLLEYTLEVTARVGDGTYVNKVWMEGLDSELQLTKSREASSTFTIQKDPVVAAQSENNGLVAQDLTVTRTEDPTEEEPQEFLPPIVLGTATEIAQASGPEPVSESAESSQVELTLILVGLVALAYAGHRAIQRFLI
jgi:hypothetical protein